MRAKPFRPRLARLVAMRKKGVCLRMSPMSDERTISVFPDALRALSFDVVVREGRSVTRHRVTIGADDAARWGKLGAGPQACVQAAMLFLLDREPKESILAAFDIRVIQRYFPEFNGAFPDYLARLGREAGERA